MFVSPLVEIMSEDLATGRIAFPSVSSLPSLDRSLQNIQSALLVESDPSVQRRNVPAFLITSKSRQ